MQKGHYEFKKVDSDDQRAFHCHPDLLPVECMDMIDVRKGREVSLTSFDVYEQGKGVNSPLCSYGDVWYSNYDIENTRSWLQDILKSDFGEIYFISGSD